MKAVQSDLNDVQHEKVTRLLVRLSAYNVMRLLHELQQTRLQRAFGRSNPTGLGPLLRWI
jgi:hypothetical protein